MELVILLALVSGISCRVHATNLKEAQPVKKFNIVSSSKDEVLSWIFHCMIHDCKRNLICRLFPDKKNLCRHKTTAQAIRKSFEFELCKRKLRINNQNMSSACHQNPNTWRVLSFFLPSFRFQPHFETILAIFKFRVTCLVYFFYSRTTWWCFWRVTMDQMDKMAHRFVILIPNLNGNNKAIKKLILKVLKPCMGYWWVLQEMICRCRTISVSISAEWVFLSTMAHFLCPSCVQREKDAMPRF